ncbi:hypothetical protein RND71_012939 [Anisodus tanguticus]|uniref:Uncharacterized protein n=1 Tax=Anisodus tanguticus TaxID=243964 RepID=A0AAE1SGC7_9SOLA|nr:hypothetical protein RND71_012939 [Anisodus tanguticus]
MGKLISLSERECDFPKDATVAIEEETCNLDGKGAEQVNGFERRKEEQFDCIYNQQIAVQNSATNSEIQSDGINSNEANWKEQNLDAIELDDLEQAKCNRCSHQVLQLIVHRRIIVEI